MYLYWPALCPDHLPTRLYHSLLHSPNGRLCLPLELCKGLSVAFQKQWEFPPVTSAYNALQFIKNTMHLSYHPSIFIPANHTNDQTTPVNVSYSTTSSMLPPSADCLTVSLPAWQSAIYHQPTCQTLQASWVSQGGTPQHHLGVYHNNLAWGDWPQNFNPLDGWNTFEERQLCTVKPLI